MKKITSNLVLNDYHKLKSIALLAYKFKLYSFCMDTISIASSLMYSFNIFYTDNDLEQLLKKISLKLFSPLKQKFIHQDNNSKRVVFYDYFSIDNRGLSEQYLSGLIDLGYDILFVTLQKDQSKMQNILRLLNKYSRSEIYQIKSKKNITSCREIINKIVQFEPSKILFHSAPWDVVGCIALTYFEGQCERYLINLTDHTFWLGKCSNDYFIEFRSYGANISSKYRNIEKSKLMMLPYYPIVNTTDPFHGFNFDYKNKKIIFSGGSVYKIYGSPIFLDIVKYILNTYHETIFLYLGNGDDRLIKKFINDNNFNERFYFENERKDINEVFKRCYFYLGTYPLCGGLMSQFAVQNEKVIVSYTDVNLCVNYIDELFINKTNGKFVYNDLDELYREIDKLITSKEYYNQRTNELKNLLISKAGFASSLQKCFEKKKTEYLHKEYDIDIKSVSQFNLDQKNNLIYEYFRCFTKNKFISLIYIKYTFKFIMHKLFKIK